MKHFFVTQSCPSMLCWITPDNLLAVLHRAHFPTGTGTAKSRLLVSFAAQPSNRSPPAGCTQKCHRLPNCVLPQRPRCDPCIMFHEKLVFHPYHQYYFEQLELYFVNLERCDYDNKNGKSIFEKKTFIFGGYITSYLWISQKRMTLVTMSHEKSAGWSRAPHVTITSHYRSV